MILVKSIVKRVTTDGPSRPSWGGAAEDEPAEVVESRFIQRKKSQRTWIWIICYFTNRCWTDSETNV